MLDLTTKVTKRHTANVGDIRLMITETHTDKVFVEAYKDGTYSNSMYFVVSSMDEAMALAQKVIQFFNENGPVMIAAKDNDFDYSAPHP